MPLSHAILGFIEYQPMSGYDLKKLFDISIFHFWSATQSHIYKALDGLEKMGYAEVQVVSQDGKPNRKEYHITEAGRAELHQWLVTPLDFEQSRVAWLIQIFFSHFSSNEEIASLLEARMKHIREHVENLHGSVQEGLKQNADELGVERASQLWQITLDYGINHYENELQWLEKTIQQVRNLSPLTMPKKLLIPE